MSSASASGRPSASLHYAVGEINGKLDQLMVAILPQLQALTQADDAMGMRLDVLENKLSWLYGAGAVVVFLIGAWEVVRVVVHL
jgi:hypothetical protein